MACFIKMMENVFVEIETIRIILLVVMLGIAGIFDVKTRRIPDVLWLIFGGIGTVLYIWDHEGTITPYHHIAIITSVCIALMIYRWRIAGLADSIAVGTMTVILPVYYEFVMMPIMILIMAFFTVVFVMVLYNITLNITDLIHSRKLFSEFKNEPKYKKLFAFVAIHRKRKHEKFVIPAENSMNITPDVKSFVFLSSRNKVTRENQLLQINEMYVQSVPPLIAYMFGVAVFLLLPEILNMLFS